MDILNNLPEIEQLWKRPTNVKFPSVWHRFETRPKDGKIYKVRIEEATPDRFEEAIDFMNKFYFNDEPLSVSSKLLEDELSHMIYIYVLTKALEQCISIIAVLDEDIPRPQMIGLHILTVSSRDDPPLPEVPGDVINVFRRMYYHIRQKANPFDVLNLDVVLHDWGLCVDPAFRGLNVGYNILASLEKVARAFDISGAVIMFTRIESQILAEKLGYTLQYELVYDEYKDEEGKKIFPITDHKSLKYMSIVYESK